MLRTPSRTIASITLTFCLVGLLPLRAAAWGQDGHKIVAAVALWRLEQLKARNAQKNISDILKSHPETPIPEQPMDLFAAATWPDDVRGVEKYRFADNLHFVSIALTKDGVPDHYDPAEDCKPLSTVPQIPEGVCIIGALKHYTRVLADPSAKKSARIEALAFVVHFMGDIHQPLHTSEDKNFINYLNDTGDRGGNFRFIFYLEDAAFNSNDIKSCLTRPDACTEKFEERSNRKLHAAWDKYMIRTEMSINPNRKAGFNAYANDLVKQLPPSPLDQMFGEMEKGDFVAWAEQTHHVAELNAYDLTGPECGKLKISPADNKKYRFYLLDEAYRAKNIRVIDQQLIRAGIRLAAVLQRLFPES